VSNRTNVLLVVLDSVRAKNTSLHGYERETTPFLSSFADRSTVYTQARAPGTHSIASHVSIFTGAHVEEHRARRHIAQIDPSRTVWRQLRTEFGYNTGLFTNNRVVSNASNLADAFEHVHEPDYPLAKRLENHVDGTVLKRAYFRGYDGLARLSEALGRSEPSESETTAVDTRERTERQKNGARAEGTGPLGGLSARLVAGAERITELTGLSEFGADSGYKTLHGGNFTDAFLS
jgi:arylsulfatase A-like enzyme